MDMPSSDYISSSQLLLQYLLALDMLTDDEGFGHPPEFADLPAKSPEFECCT
jgi:hypothetical protein